MKPKKVKYEVTDRDDGYGDYDVGDVLDVWLIVKEWGTGLLFHPNTRSKVDGKWQCASISIGVSDNMSGTRWIALKNDAYINLTKKQEKFFIKAFGIPK